jgi:hypothetical protein
MSRSPRVSASVQAEQVDRVLTTLSRQPRSSGRTVSAITQAALYNVGGARWASVSVAGPGRFRTLVATAAMASAADALQHELGSGPVVDPTSEGVVQLIGDLSRDRRWPVFAAQATQRLGLAGLVAYRLPLPGVPGTVVVLSLYSDACDAFDGPGLWTGALLAVQAVQAVSAGHHQPTGQPQHDRDAALEVGTATGVLMARYGRNRQEAAQMLRAAADASGRPLGEVATEVIDTEVLRLPPMPAGPPTGRPLPDPASDPPTTMAITFPGRPAPWAP